MHERLFANPKTLGVDDLKRHATELGLNAERLRVASTAAAAPPKCRLTSRRA
jgi:hypothetical protein